MKTVTCNNSPEMAAAKKLLGNNPGNQPDSEIPLVAVAGGVSEFNNEARREAIVSGLVGISRNRRVVEVTEKTAPRVRKQTKRPLALATIRFTNRPRETSRAAAS